MIKPLNAVAQYARMWPREIFDHIAEDGTSTTKPLAKALELLDKPGVYVLYREDLPYYVGQATKLRQRLWLHATKPQSRYYNFWNFFSAFVILNPAQRDEIEGILIAAMPTANSAQPRLEREKFPPAVISMVRKLRRDRANPS
jgi:hypothetical protein